jgi:hypothetical protein
MRDPTKVDYAKPYGGHGREIKLMCSPRPVQPHLGLGHALHSDIPGSTQ